MKSVSSNKDIKMFIGIDSLGGFRKLKGKTKIAYFCLSLLLYSFTPGSRKAM